MGQGAGWHGVAWLGLLVFTVSRHPKPCDLVLSSWQLLVTDESEGKRLARQKAGLWLLNFSKQESQGCIIGHEKGETRVVGCRIKSIASVAVHSQSLIHQFRGIVA